MTLFQQRMVGVGLLILSIIIYILAVSGCGDPGCTNPECHDATAIMFTIPMGIYMMMGKK